MPHYERIRVFKSDFLERFSVVHPCIPALIFVPFMLYCAVHIKISILSLLFIVLGLLSWTLLEYSLHRFVFHLPINTQWAKKIRYIVHEIHHKDPMDPLRLVAPPIMSIPLGLFFVFLFSTMLAPYVLYGFIFGMILGYLCYDYLHWMLHHTKSKNKVFYYLRRNHALHHHSKNNRRFGVTSPLWDIIFNTYNLNKEK